MKPCSIHLFPPYHISLTCFQVVVGHLSFLPHFTFALKPWRQEAVLHISYMDKLYVGFFTLQHVLSWAGIEDLAPHASQLKGGGPVSLEFRRYSVEFCFSMAVLGPSLKELSLLCPAQLCFPLPHAFHHLHEGEWMEDFWAGHDLQTYCSSDTRHLKVIQRSTYALLHAYQVI